MVGVDAWDGLSSEQVCDEELFEWLFLIHIAMKTIHFGKILEFEVVRRWMGRLYDG